MDFSKQQMEDLGFGVYQPLQNSCDDSASQADLLTVLNNADNNFGNFKFFLAYSEAGLDSGGTHSDVKERFAMGEEKVVEAMGRFADIAEKGKAVFDRLLLALKEQKWKSTLAMELEALGKLMNENFDLRRTIYGEAVIGKQSVNLTFGRIIHS